MELLAGDANLTELLRREDVPMSWRCTVADEDVAVIMRCWARALPTT